MTSYHDLIYHIENIGHIDVHWLGLLFLLINLKDLHPSIHDGLVPAIMDGTITVEHLESHMNYYFDLHNAQINKSLIPSTSFGLAAQSPLHTILCGKLQKAWSHNGVLCVPWRSDGRTVHN